MRRAFIINLILILLINLLVKPLYIFGIDIQVQNRLGPEEYGLFFTLFSFTYLLQIINDFGIQIYNTRSIARKPGAVVQQFGAFLKVKLLLAIVYTILIWAVAWALGYVIYGKLLLLIMINQILISFVLFLRSNISGLGLYRTDSILSAMDKGIMILLCGALLYLPGLREDFNLERFVYAQTASLVITGIIAWVTILRKSKQVEKEPTPVFTITGLLRASGPFALAVFLMTIYTRIDTVMIEQLVSDGKREAGVYAAGFRLLDAVNMIAFLFTPLLLPMFSKLLDRIAELKALLRTSFEIMFALCISVSLLGYFFSEEIMGFLYKGADRHWMRVFSLLILSFIPMGLAYIFGTLQTARGNMKRLNWLYGALVTGNILLNFILIPDYLAAGAAIATLATQSIATATLVLFTINDYRIKVSFRYCLRIAGFTVLMAISVYAIASLAPWSFLFRFILAILCMGLLSLTWGLFKPGVLLSLTGRQDQQ
jgi:O-antigen/teichoic acid export membrane protein